jgi:hypothetical protein
MQQSIHAFDRVQSNDFLGSLKNHLEGFHDSGSLHQSSKQNGNVPSSKEFIAESVHSGATAIGTTRRLQIANNIALAKQTRSGTEHSPEVFSKRRADIERIIQDAANEASTPDWDGEGAQIASTVSVTAARRFLLLLPPDIELPESFVDPSGKMHLAWERDRFRVFGISFSHTGKISYAGLFFGAAFQGTLPIISSIPSEIIGHIRKIFGYRKNDALNVR